MRPCCCATRWQPAGVWRRWQAEAVDVSKGELKLDPRAVMLLLGTMERLLTVKVARFTRARAVCVCVCECVCVCVCLCVCMCVCVRMWDR